MTGTREADRLAAGFLFRSRHERVLAVWAAVRASAAGYASRIGEILEAAQAGHLPAVFGDDGFAGLAVAPGAVLPPGWRHDGEIAVPDRSVSAGLWVSRAIAGEWVRVPDDLRRVLPGLPAGISGPAVLDGWCADLLEDGRALYVGWLQGVPEPSAVEQPDPRLWEGVA
jgi:hypothetical protein